MDVVVEHVAEGRHRAVEGGQVVIGAEDGRQLGSAANAARIRVKTSGWTTTSESTKTRIEPVACIAPTLRAPAGPMPAGGIHHDHLVRGFGRLADGRDAALGGRGPIGGGNDHAVGELLRLRGESLGCAGQWVGGR